MELIDSHAHLLAEYYDADETAAALARARADGVVALVDVATDLDDGAEVMALAEREADVWATVGVHPHEARVFAERGADAVVAELRARAGHPRVVAIGECGLDYHYDHSPRDVQRQALRLQVRLARELGRPLVLHNRESDDDLLAILREEGAAEAGGVVHAFSTTEEVARACLELGFHLGFGGMITFKKADEIRRALKVTPLDRLLLETDSPYLTPAPHRGQRNEPARVRLVCERAAHELGIAVDEVATRTTANARRLFGLTA